LTGKTNTSAHIAKRFFRSKKLLTGLWWGIAPDVSVDLIWTLEKSKSMRGLFESD